MNKIEEIDINGAIFRSSFRDYDLRFILQLMKHENYGYNIQLGFTLDEAEMLFNFVSRSFRSYIERYRDYKESVSYRKDVWHKVSDELPTKDVPVLFMTADNETSLLSMYMGYMDENEWWISDDGSILETYGTPGAPIGVMYWRELKTVK